MQKANLKIYIIWSSVIPLFMLSELPNYSYRIIYEIQADQIEVLAVIHKRQEINKNDIFR